MEKKTPLGATWLVTEMLVSVQSAKGGTVTVIVALGGLVTQVQLAVHLPGHFAALVVSHSSPGLRTPLPQLTPGGAGNGRLRTV
jgi:hypothetical protein